jgi:ribosomal protein L11 methyltransferase
MSKQEYQVVTLRVSAADTDWVQGELYDQGCLGLIEENGESGQVVLKAYFNQDEKSEERLRYLQSLIPGSCEATSIKLNASDFRPAPFDPINLAGDCWVVPPEDLVNDNLAGPVPYHAITIVPGMAFGTGQHETTQLCADAILNLVPMPKSLLDVGTGSGILAILAKKIGIKRVVAVEISEDARRNARENFELNHIDDIDLYHDLDLIKDTYDVVVANILTPTILNLQTELLSRLISGSKLILSGITYEEDRAIEQAFSSLKCLAKSESGGWYCYVYELII